MPAEGAHPYYLRSSKTGDRQGYSTLDTAREALLAWVFAQRQAGETVIEQDERSVVRLPRHEVDRGSG